MCTGVVQLVGPDDEGRLLHETTVKAAHSKARLRRIAAHHRSSRRNRRSRHVVFKVSLFFPGFLQKELNLKYRGSPPSSTVQQQARHRKSKWQTTAREWVLILRFLADLQKNRNTKKMNKKFKQIFNHLVFLAIPLFQVYIEE